MVNKDFEEFFGLLNVHNVEYLIVGGVAYNYYAPPRATKDIDVWVCPSVPNLEHFKDALSAFGFPVEDLDIATLQREQTVLMLGRVPNRIDILTRPTGVQWESCWDKRERDRYGEVSVAILSKDCLIQAKRAAGRPRDIADVAMLCSLPDGFEPDGG